MAFKNLIGIELLCESLKINMQMQNMVTKLATRITFTKAYHLHFCHAPPLLTQMLRKYWASNVTVPFIDVSLYLSVQIPNDNWGVLYCAHT